MQTENPKAQNELCERCGVVHTQEPVDVEKVAASAIDALLESENAEWARMARITEPHYMTGEMKKSALVCEGIVDEMKLRGLGIDMEALKMFDGDTMAGEALRVTSEQTEALRERYKLFPHQQATMDWVKEQFRVKQLIDPKVQEGFDFENNELNFHPVFVGGDFVDPQKVYAAGISGRQMPITPMVVAGLSEGIYPDIHYGISRGVMRFKHPQLSQIPKTPAAQKLFRERLQADGFTRDGQLVDFKTNGEYIPKAGSDARIMFMVDSLSPMDMTRTFIHEAGHAEAYMEQQFRRGRMCGKTRTNMALHEYESKHANHAFYEGTPGRPKADKAKRKAQKAARKRNTKCKK